MVMIIYNDFELNTTLLVYEVSNNLTAASYLSHLQYNSCTADHPSLTSDCALEIFQRIYDPSMFLMTLRRSVTTGLCVKCIDPKLHEKHLLVSQ